MNHPLPATPATERALAAYRAIRHFFEKEDRLPNYGELARSLGVHTTTAQHRFGELVLGFALIWHMWLVALLAVVAVIAYTAVEVSLGRRFSTDLERDQVIQWISDAELQIRAKLGDLAALDQDALKFVVREAAAARARNPEGFQYEAIDDYRYGMPAESRKVTILPEWWGLLSPGRDAAAYSVQPTFEPDAPFSSELGWS
jgi:hypothetical protein